MFSSEECPDANQDVTIPVHCVIQFPEKYVNKTITIKGEYVAYYMGGVEKRYILGKTVDHTDYQIYFVPVDGVDTTSLVPYDTYYFTGIPRFMSYTDPDKFSEYNNIQFEVSKIKHE